MDRRNLLGLAGILIAALAGCARREVVQTDPYTTVQASAPPARHSASRPVRKRETKEVIAREPDAKPENMVKFAKVHALTAIDADRAPEQRQLAFDLAKKN